MIKINLLGVPKPKRGKRSGGGAAPEMGGGGGEGLNPMVLLAIFAIATIGGVWFFWNAENTRATKLAADKVTAERENRSLSEVKATFERKQREADNYRRRVEVIDQLRSNQAQSGVVSLLTLVGDTVNSTDAVWLNKLTDEPGAGIKIEGTALNVHAVANLINNLQKTGYFKSVEMTESIQDEKKPETGDIQAFSFQITCEVNKAAPPATSAQKS
ncbi:MAG: PilN domain-containing protein [Terriglobales bacterium]|jgi:Tfp pilus assembly protein PilN